VAGIREIKYSLRIKFYSQTLEGGDHLGDLGVDGRIILNGS
jgi:hypothetical protein